MKEKITYLGTEQKNRKSKDGVLVRKTQKYEASIIAAMFDKDYHFESLLNLGVSHSYEETVCLIHEDEDRLIQDFEPQSIEVSKGRDDYDEPIEIVKYGSGYAHYYCLFMPKSQESVKQVDE